MAVRRFTRWRHGWLAWLVIAVLACANTAAYAHQTLAKPARIEYEYFIWSIGTAIQQGKIEWPVEVVVPGLKPEYRHDEYGHLSAFYTDWGNNDAKVLVNLVRAQYGYGALPPEMFRFNVGERPAQAAPDHWLIDLYPLVETGLYFKHSLAQ